MVGGHRYRSRKDSKSNFLLLADGELGNLKCPFRQNRASHESGDRWKEHSHGHARQVQAISRCSLQPCPRALGFLTQSGEK